MIRRFLCLVLVLILCIGHCSASGPSSEVGGYVSPDVDTFLSASGGVDGHIGLSAYLGAHGIYLKANADMSSFSDFSLGLDSLWDDFAQAAGSGISNLADMSVSLVRGGLAFSKKQWDLYAKFGRWVIDKFSLQDNQTNQELVDNNQTVQGNLLTTNWLYLGDYGAWTGSSSHNYSGLCRIKLANPLSGIYVFFKSNGNTGNYKGYYIYIYNAGINTVSSNDIVVYLSSGYSSSIPLLDSVRPGSTGYFDTRFQVYSTYGGTPHAVNQDIPVVTGSYVPPDEPEPDTDFLLVDTGTIQTPQDIPDDATGGSSVGGILIPALGAGLGGAAGAVASTIAGAVMDGALPDIDLSPADVNVSPDVEVGPDGRIRPADIDINASDIFLDSDNYMLADLKNYFPFSIPWDMMAFAAGFRAEPETPKVNFVIHMPDEIRDIEIMVDLTPWDSVAALLREGSYVLFCIRWLMFLYRKFT